MPAVSNGLHHSAAWPTVINPAINAIATVIELALGAVAPGIEAGLTALSSSVQFLIDPVAFGIEMFGTIGVAVVFGVFRAGIEVLVDAIASGVEPGFCCEAPLVQPFIDSFATFIEAFIGSIAAVLCQGGQREQRKQGGCEHVYISLHCLFLCVIDMD